MPIQLGRLHRTARSSHSRRARRASRRRRVGAAATIAASAFSPWLSGCAGWFGATGAPAIDSSLRPSVEGRGELGFAVGERDKRLMETMAGGGGYTAREHAPYGLFAGEINYSQGDDYRWEVGGEFTARFFALGHTTIATGPTAAMYFHLPQRSSSASSSDSSVLIGPKLTLEVESPADEEPSASNDDVRVKAMLGLVARWEFADSTHSSFHF